MFADDVDGLLKFLEKSSIQLSNWLDTDEERATRRCYRRQRTSSSSTSSKHSSTKWPVAIKKSQSNKVKDSYRLQAQNNKPAARRRNRKSWTQNVTSCTDKTNIEPNLDNANINLSCQQHQQQSQSLLLSSHNHHGSISSVSGGSRLAHQQIADSLASHHNVLDGQLSLVISAEELNPIDHGSSISPGATHLSPIDPTIQFQSIHHQQQHHYYPIQKHQIIDSYSHGLHDEPFSNNDQMQQLTSNNPIEHSNHQHQHHQHSQSGRLNMGQLDHRPQHGHDEQHHHQQQQQQQHEHIHHHHNPNATALSQPHHEHQNQRHHHQSDHHHQHHQHHQNHLLHQQHGQLSSDPKRQHPNLHQPSELSSTLNSLTSADCYQIQGGEARQHPAQYNQHIEHQWLTPVASNTIASDDTFHLGPADGSHLDQVVGPLDSPGGHQSLDQVHFGVPLYHHSYYGHHQGDQLGSFQSHISDDSYTTLNIQPRSNGIGTSVATSSDPLARPVGLTGEHETNSQQQQQQQQHQQQLQLQPHQSSQQHMPQLQNLDATNVDGNQPNFAMTNGNIGNFDRHVQIQHNQHSLDQQSLQQDYHSSNSHRLQQHQGQLDEHHSHDHHELQQQLNQHQLHNQNHHHQQQISLMNGLEPNGVILQDINLASASWSSPEDLYTI